MAGIVIGASRSRADQSLVIKNLAYHQSPNEAADSVWKTLEEKHISNYIKKNIR